ncbi:hypothetical protein [Magnetospirillum sp. UT-4]|uniref:hypothetical protein n=1 Tax=Magnetospirillum sp. UT-4 TaxID=2681467 RepID=UPI0013844DBE|nr:hypothetical protein [Magnetospirillum sp. UT-4]CAA7621135.1 hypothetical protein MTBUT4_380019 [Magnetospirillum sp. UT-4]
MTDFDPTGFAITEQRPGELHRFFNHASRLVIAAVVESARRGRVWPELQRALEDAGFEIRRRQQ